MWNARLDETQSWNQDFARRNIINLRNENDTTLIPENKKEPKSLSMKVRKWRLKNLA